MANNRRGLNGFSPRIDTVEAGWEVSKGDSCELFFGHFCTAYWHGSPG